ncbi:MAG: transposase, partial [Candidatus Latescibacteria bacterium]|nr:transposase [Candidatus Latescibacterota bacterium]
MSFIRKIKKGNSVYLAEVENKRIDGRIVQKHIRYVGKEVDDKPILTGSVERSTVDKVTMFGPLLVLNEIASQIGLAEVLGDYGNYLLSLAYAHCVAPDSLKGMSQWYEKTEISNLLDIPTITYKRLVEALDSLDGRDGDTVQERIFSRLKDVLNLSPSGYLYDITNIYFYGVCCPLARKGQNAERRNLPQIQIGLAVTKEDGIPIYHKVFDGNIFDSKTLPDILLHLKRHEIKNVCIVWDRGVSSKLTIGEAKGMGFDVLCGLALKTGLKKIVDSVVGDDIVSMKHRVRLRNATFYVKKQRYEVEGLKGYIAICVNEQQRQEIRERRYDEVDQALQLLKEKKAIKAGLRKYITYKTINHRALQVSERYDGISVIFSTRNLKAEDMVKGYFEKDRVEKSFRCLKSFLEMDKVRFWLANRVRGHIFICYLAYLLLSVLEYRLKESSMSAVNVLKSMESMYKVYLTDPKSKNTFVKTVT